MSTPALARLSRAVEVEAERRAVGLVGAKLRIPTPETLDALDDRALVALGVAVHRANMRRLSSPPTRIGAA